MGDPNMCVCVRAVIWTNIHIRFPKHPIRFSKAKGYEIGCELGYYAGCAATWLEVIQRWNERGGTAADTDTDTDTAAAAAAAAGKEMADAAPPAENVERCAFVFVWGGDGLNCIRIWLM